MNDKEILTVTKAIERYALFAQLVAMLCIASFLWNVREAEELEDVDAKGEATKIIDQMMKVRVILEMVCSSISKKFYTTLAGVDYMVSTIVEDRRFEKMLIRVPATRSGRGQGERRAR